MATNFLSTPGGVTALKEMGYLGDLTSLQLGKTLTFQELPKPILAFLREAHSILCIPP